MRKRELTSGLAGGTRMRLPAKGFSVGAIMSFYLNLTPFGRTQKISDTDLRLNGLKRSTDYTALYFINAAAFMKWKQQFPLGL